MPGKKTNFQRNPIIKNIPLGNASCNNHTYWTLSGSLKGSPCMHNDREQYKKTFVKESIHKIMLEFYYLQWQSTAQNENMKL